MGIIEAAHNIKVLGSGGEVVVLSHGIGTDQSVWKHLVPHLLDEYRVVLFDNMGAGTTNPDHYDFVRYGTIDGFVNDLLAILEELQIKSCIYVGHSFTSMVGAIASVVRPDLFSKLILISATPRLCNDVDYNGGFEKEDLDRVIHGMMSNYEAFMLGFAPLFVGGDLDSEPMQEYCRTLFNMKPDIALSVTQIIHNLDVRDVLPLITVPCHILQSMKDLAVPLVVTEYLCRNIGAQCIVELMLTEGHLPQLSAPDVAIPVIFKHIHDIFLE